MLYFFEIKLWLLIDNRYLSYQPIYFACSASQTFLFDLLRVNVAHKADFRVFHLFLSVDFTYDLFCLTLHCCPPCLLRSARFWLTLSFQMTCPNYFHLLCLISVVTATAVVTAPSSRSSFDILPGQNILNNLQDVWRTDSQWLSLFRSLQHSASCSSTDIAFLLKIFSFVFSLMFFDLRAFCS